MDCSRNFELSNRCLWRPRWKLCYRRDLINRRLDCFNCSREIFLSIKPPSICSKEGGKGAHQSAPFYRYVTVSYSKSLMTSSESFLCVDFAAIICSLSAMQKNIKKRFSVQKKQGSYAGFLFIVTVPVQYLFAVFEKYYSQLQYSESPFEVSVRYNGVLWCTHSWQFWFD